MAGGGFVLWRRQDRHAWILRRATAKVQRENRGEVERRRKRVEDCDRLSQHRRCSGASKSDRKRQHSWGHHQPHIHGLSEHIFLYADAESNTTPNFPSGHDGLRLKFWLVPSDLALLLRPGRACSDVARLASLPYVNCVTLARINNNIRR
ncbi:hypothetical protein L484_011513 [Morus notabilis]|uniref:Uncharacterized protein n=1 Tax=Morus notabilis TaxID=981085 RepID=W9RXU2_9ROSA|nr:hypothetical protein L484_011513 [Morus notabilis]